MTIDMEQFDEFEPRITSAENLPKGWFWMEFEDGSGMLISPDKKPYFSYDRQPYHQEGGVEYEETYRPGRVEFDVYWGDYSKFKNHMELTVRERYLHLSEKSPNERKTLSEWKSEAQQSEKSSSEIEQQNKAVPER